VLFSSWLWGQYLMNASAAWCWGAAD